MRRKKIITEDKFMFKVNKDNTTTIYWCCSELTINELAWSSVTLVYLSLFFTRVIL